MLQAECQMLRSDPTFDRTGDKRDHCSDLINVPVAVECSGGLLRHCPLARRGIQLRVDRTRLNVVNRDASAPRALETAPE